MERVSGLIDWKNLAEPRLARIEKELDGNGREGLIVKTAKIETEVNGLIDSLKEVKTAQYWSIGLQVSIALGLAAMALKYGGH